VLALIALSFGYEAVGASGAVSPSSFREAIPIRRFSAAGEQIVIAWLPSGGDTPHTAWSRVRRPAGGGARGAA